MRKEDGVNDKPTFEKLVEKLGRFPTDEEWERTQEAEKWYNIGKDAEKRKILNPWQ